MKRGEIWSAAAGSGYGGKPRPVLILQEDSIPTTDSVIVGLFTTDPLVAPLVRFPVAPDATNNLSRPCSLQVEKVVAIPRAKVGQHIGRLDDQQMARVNGLVATIMGLARPVGGAAQP